MNLLDLLIVLMAIAFAIGGFRNGAIVGLLSMFGFFAGAVVGAQIAEPLGRRVANGQAQIPVAIVCVLFLAMAGQLLGVWAASLIKQRLVNARVRPWDSGVGAALGVLSVLLVAWMVAVPLASSPYPTLSAEAAHSGIVRTVNSVMPNDVRSLYSSLRQFLDRSGFPPVLGDLPPDVVSVPPPDKNLSPALNRQTDKAAASVFKIYGEARKCSRGIEGTGFAYAPHHIITNAHVVAGTNQVGVVVGRETVPATVVLFDPKRDVAVLYVKELNAPLLHFAPSPAPRGAPAAVMGFPEDSPSLITKAARIRSRITVQGNDIYGDNRVRREIYSVRSTVRSGNSGGPLLATDGSVLGIVFATALDSSDTGYVLTADDVSVDANNGATSSTAARTGSCTPD